jgi:hypothetical protein
MRTRERKRPDRLWVPWSAAGTRLPTVQLQAHIENLEARRLLANAHLAPAAVSAGEPGAPEWSFVISTAPGLPQDVWVTGKGNNSDGWISAGVFCLGPLAQGLGPTQHATVDADVVQAGIYGVDGTPVPPDTYTLPGGELHTDGRTGPAELLGPRDYTLTPGKTFFIIFDARIVESNIAEFPKGSEFDFMFTFDFDPDAPESYGNTQRYIAAWIDFDPTEAGSFVPFLNEGIMMTNVRNLK